MKTPVKIITTLPGVLLAAVAIGWSLPLPCKPAPADFSAVSNTTATAGVPAAVNPTTATNSNSTVSAGQSPPVTQPSGLQFSWFHTHPFHAAVTNSIYSWTAEDGRDTNVILHLAHNELEHQRMLMENGTIYRRQLVYFEQGFATQAQQALQTGRSLRQITLPGLNGQELTVNVTRTDFKNGGSRGQIYGHLAGRPDSTVTVAFVNSREAFTVISPQDQIYLQAEAREPGEIVVKSINPATYGRPQQ